MVQGLGLRKGHFPLPTGKKAFPVRQGMDFLRLGMNPARLGMDFLRLGMNPAPQGMHFLRLGIHPAAKGMRPAPQKVRPAPQGEALSRPARDLVSRPDFSEKRTPAY